MPLNCKLALSANGKMINEELFSQYAENGIEAIEISVGENEYDTLDYNEIKRLSEKYGVRLRSFHFPFSPFGKIDISLPQVAPYTVAKLKKYMDNATAIGIKLFVIHASGEPIEDSERSARMECAKASLAELAEYARALGAVIAVEDLPRTCLGNCASDILELTSAHEALRVCFDTNHLLNEDDIDFVSKVGKKIITLHVSDYDFINERHWMPGEGKVDWDALIGALEEIGYDGYWLYEIRFEAPWSIDRERALTCADFKRNFDELMQKRPLTRLGKAKENLGMWEAL